MKAITLHAPWATLLVTRQPCAGYQHGDDSSCRCSSMVKRFETRSWSCPPSIIGQRVAFHQGKKRPKDYWCSFQRDPEFPPELAPLYDYDRCVDPQESNDGEWWRYRWAGPLGAIVGSGVIAASLPIKPDHWPKAGKIVVAPSGRPDVLHLMDIDDLSYVDISDQLPYGDWTAGRFAWAVENVRPLSEPVPAKGHQGWWTLDEATTAEVIRCGG